MPKLRVIDRLLMALYALLGIALCVALGAAVHYRDQLSFAINGSTYNLSDNPIVVLALVVAVAVILFLSVRALLIAMRLIGRIDKSSVAVQNTQDGAVHVSVQAMDMLVKQAVSKTEGIADVKTRVDNHGDSITVHVEMTLNSDVYIPNVSTLMQRNIKSFVQEYSGIEVREVSIMVNRIMEVQAHPPLQIAEPQPDSIVIDEIDEEDMTSLPQDDYESYEAQFAAQADPFDQPESPIDQAEDTHEHPQDSDE